MRTPPPRTLQGLAAALGIALVAWLHYSAGVHGHHGGAPHDLYRRLFHLPILGAAWAFGLRGGLAAALATIAVYSPHAFGLFGLHADPASTTDKLAEFLLYLGVGGLVGAFVDRERRESSALRAALAELQAARDRLVAAEHQAALGHLTAGLAHEIRNPLASIRGSAEILGDALPEASRHRRIAQLLVGETERLDDVLTRFLSFASPAPRQRVSTDLVALVDDVVALVEAEARQRGVELRRVGGEGVAPLDLDPVSVRQLVLNLVVNGLQAQQEGGTVELRLARVGDEVALRVEDAGPGLAAADRQRVFHPYVSGRAQGTGLGLSIARRVATDHGGALTAGDSDLGGAAFELRLPVRHDHEP